MGDVVHVRLGDVRCGIPVVDVVEIAAPGRRAPVPGAPRGVIGVRNLRGTLMPAVDLAIALDLGPAPEALMVVMVDVGGLRAGLGVTEVLDVAPLGDARLIDVGALLRALVDGGEVAA